MTTLHQLTDNCLAVAGLPSDADNFVVLDLWFFGFGDALNFRLKNDKLRTIQLPTGNWRILGKSNELTEEQWKEVGPTPAIRPKYGYLYDHVSATESGASLLKLHKLENPLILIKE